MDGPRRNFPERPAAADPCTPNAGSSPVDDGLVVGQVDDLPGPVARALT